MLKTLRHGHSFFAQLILGLAFMAAGTQAALPQGFMIDRNAATGAVSIVICTGHTTETRYVDFSTGRILEKSPAEEGQSEVQPCSFSASTSALLKPEIGLSLHKAHFTRTLAPLQKPEAKPLFQAQNRQNPRAPPATF